MKNIEQKIALLRIGKHRIVKKKQGSPTPTHPPKNTLCENERLCKLLTFILDNPVWQTPALYRASDEANNLRQLKDVAGSQMHLIKNLLTT